jgi:hypothetical protein
MPLRGQQSRTGIGTKNAKSIGVIREKTLRRLGVANLLWKAKQRGAVRVCIALLHSQRHWQPIHLKLQTTQIVGN